MQLVISYQNQVPFIILVVGTTSTNAAYYDVNKG
jgi:hypothetical protein